MHLNMHLNRIKNCTLCPHPYEIIKHFIFKCPQKALPSINPNIGNPLYGQANQLQNMVVFLIMADTEQKFKLRLDQESKLQRSNKEKW